MFNYKGVIGGMSLMARMYSRRIAWWDLMHLSEIQMRNDTHGILFVHGIAAVLIVTWYCATIQNALSGVYIDWLELTAFLIIFKLAAISLGLFFLKDYIKSSNEYLTHIDTM